MQSIYPLCNSSYLHIQGKLHWITLADMQLDYKIVCNCILQRFLYYWLLCITATFVWIRSVSCAKSLYWIYHYGFSLPLALTSEGSSARGHVKMRDQNFFFTQESEISSKKWAIPSIRHTLKLFLFQIFIESYSLDMSQNIFS